MKWALYILTAGAALCGVMAVTAATKSDAKRASEGRVLPMKKPS